MLTNKKRPLSRPFKMPLDFSSASFFSAHSEFSVSSALDSFFFFQLLTLNFQPLPVTNFPFLLSARDAAAFPISGSTGALFRAAPASINAESSTRRAAVPITTTGA
jgi:hypothetical protein